MTLAMEPDRDAWIDWYRTNRRRSRELFEVASAEAYYDRPIPLRNPICFYEGHLPAFSVNTLIKRGLKERGVDDEYETLFERGIDPEDETAVRNGGSPWPSRERILSYGKRARPRGPRPQGHRARRGPGAARRPRRIHHPRT